MSTIPTLALIPSGVKASKVYSVLPTDGTGDFTFSRAGALPSYNATRVNSEGLIEEVLSNVPRLNYPMIDGVVSGCPSLLLEPQRTNHVTYSNDFTDSSWLPTDATVVSGVISPDGTSNAFTLSNTASNGIIQKAVSLTGLRVVSIFAKKGTHRYLYIGAYGGTNSYANFDLENGVVTDGANANIEDYGNGWFRCICHSADGATGGVQIFPSNRTIGAATTNGSIQIYGVQLEAGSYPTSYIPTQGSQVTKVQDVCSQTLPSGIIGQTEGTMFVDFNYFGNINAPAVYEAIPLYVGTGVFSESIYFSVFQDILYLVIWKGSVNQATISLGTITKGRYKGAVSYTNNDVKVYLNGSLVGTDTSVTLPTLSAVYLGTAGTSTTPQGHSINTVSLWKTRLTNSELATLTTL